MHLSLACSLICSIVSNAIPEPQLQDWVVSAGQTRTYNTASGPLRLGSLRIEAGGVLHVVGPNALDLKVSNVVEVFGTLDLSGNHSFGVLTLNTTNQPEHGMRGGPGAGVGGTGSKLTNANTPSGEPGLDNGGQTLGGGGGETGFSTLGKEARRPAGGGGGAFASDQPEVLNPLDPANDGLIASAGWDGSATGLGAISQSTLAQGGAVGARLFNDLLADNDFWGQKASPAGTITGELLAPEGGRGGGAGGDAVDAPAFPAATFTPFGDEKGSAGGGGGGLGLVLTRRFVLGAEGRVLANGGHGGGGENTLFFDRVGGGSGGGSGGMLVIEALVMDLTDATPGALSARGGVGGFGRNNQPLVVGAGGDGGPGLIQLHIPSAGQLLLPAGFSLDDVSAPNAHVLLPILGL
ncbi:MAG: hypothetical protein ACI8QC_003896 [Planctomycetota bacterium]|jgi:hypothetical protein